MISAKVLQSLAAVWVVLSGFTQVHAQVTLFGVSDLATPSQTLQSVVISESFSLSAAGVGADGATTYIEEIVESYLALEGPSTTMVALSTPTTFTNFLVEGSSGLILSAPPLSLTFALSNSDATTVAFTALESCAFGKNGLATCVEPLPDLSSRTETFTASIVPITTLAAATGTAPPPTTPGSSTTATGTTSTPATTGAPTSSAKGRAPLLPLSILVSLLVLLVNL